MKYLLSLIALVMGLLITAPEASAFTRDCSRYPDSQKSFFEIYCSSKAVRLMDNAVEDLYLEVSEKMPKTRNGAPAELDIAFNIFMLKTITDTSCTTEACVLDMYMVLYDYILSVELPTGKRAGDTLYGPPVVYKLPNAKVIGYAVIKDLGDGEAILYLTNQTSSTKMAIYGLETSPDKFKCFEELARSDEDMGFFSGTMLFMGDGTVAIDISGANDICTTLPKSVLTDAKRFMK